MIDPFMPDWNAQRPLAATEPVRTEGAGLVAPTAAGDLRVEAFAPDVFRLRIGDADVVDYGILAAERADCEACVRRDQSFGRIEAGDLALTLETDPLRIAVERRGRTLLTSTTDGHFVRPHRLPPFARTEDGWFMALALESGEPVYGLGERFGSLNHRGKLVRSWVRDSLGVNAEASYKNCPFAWSPRGWGAFVHTPAQVLTGVGYSPWSHRSYAFEVADDVLDVFLVAGDDPAAILERYTHLTGRMPMPPLWSLGVWLSRAYYRTSEDLLGAAQRVRERSLPCDVIVLDGRAWVDTETRFDFGWDEKRYPDPKAVIDRLHALDLRLCCWEYPLVSTKSPLFSYMEERGWLLRDAADPKRAYRYQWDPEPFDSVLTPLHESGIVDFTHPDAYAYWRDRHKELFDVGVDVIKTDFGEQVTLGCLASNGDTGARLHNVYPLLYNACVFEATERHKGSPAVVLGRAGWAGSQRYPIQWGGDPQADWEGLAASIRGGLSWGLSCAPCYATDVGGFYGGRPSPELYVRWAQAAVFASHMRFHGIGPREPWTFGEEAEAIVRRFVELRYRLLPYIEGALAEASRSGLPVMRAMVLAFPQEPTTWAFDSQFLFGPDLFVKPVLRPEGRVSFYLPGGRWYDFWTGEPVKGARHLELAMPLDRIPVYVRAGAVIPLGPSVQHTGELGGGTRVETLRFYGPLGSAPCLATGALPVVDGTDGRRLRGLTEALRVEGFGGRVRRSGDAAWLEPRTA